MNNITVNVNWDYKDIYEEFVRNVAKHELIEQRKQKFDILFPNEHKFVPNDQI